MEVEVETTLKAPLTMRLLRPPCVISYHVPPTPILQGAPHCSHMVPREAGDRLGVGDSLEHGAHQIAETRITITASQ